MQHLVCARVNQPGVEDMGRGGERGCCGRERRDQALRGREHLAQGRHGVQQVIQADVCRHEHAVFLTGLKVPAIDLDSSMFNYRGTNGSRHCCIVITC